MNRHMKRRMHALGLFAAIVTLSAQMAAAAITSDDVIATYQADGYTRIEVKVGLTQLKVEAIKDDVKVETIYDIETGDILKTETEAVEPGEDTAPRISVRERNRDFLRVEDEEEDEDDEEDEEEDEDDQDEDEDEDEDEDDDHGGDHDDDNDDDEDDHGGSGSAED